MGLTLPAAISVNAAILLAKLWVHLLTGSSAMLAEALHSLADVGNQASYGRGLSGARSGFFLVLRSCLLCRVHGTGAVSESTSMRLSSLPPAFCMDGCLAGWIQDTLPMGCLE